MQFLSNLVSLIFFCPVNFVDNKLIASLSIHNINYKQIKSLACHYLIKLNMLIVKLLWYKKNKT